MGRDRSLGAQQQLPWLSLKQDRSWFRHLTSVGNTYKAARIWCKDRTQVSTFWYPEIPNVLIVGRHTFRTLPMPLSNRQICLVTNHIQPNDPPLVADSLGSALEHPWIARDAQYFVIGGGRLYADAMLHPACERYYLTEVMGEYPDADTYWQPPDPWSMMLDWDQGVMRFRCHGMPDITWHRTLKSQWIHEAHRPCYRFGIWEQEPRTENK